MVKGAFRWPPFLPSSVRALMADSKLQGKSRLLGGCFSQKQNLRTLSSLVVRGGATLIARGGATLVVRGGARHIERIDGETNAACINTILCTYVCIYVYACIDTHAHTYIHSIAYTHAQTLKGGFGEITWAVHHFHPVSISCCVPMYIHIHIRTSSSACPLPATYVHGCHGQHHHHYLISWLSSAEASVRRSWKWSSPQSKESEKELAYM